MHCLDNFYYHASYTSAVFAVIVCPSVCLPVTGQSCTKMVKPRITQTMPYDSPRTLVFWCQKSRWHSNEITPNDGGKQRWDSFKSALLDQHLAISKKQCRQGHTCYGRL